MLKFIQRLLAKWNEERPAPTYGAEICSEDQILSEYFSPSAAQIAALRNLVRLLADRLGDEGATAIADRVIQSMEPGDSTEMAFASGTSIDFDEVLSIYVDWNDGGSVEWLANRVMETLRLPDRWEWADTGNGRSVPAAFLALEEWLALRGYRLLHIKTDGDDALAFPVDAAMATAARTLAEEAGMAIFTLEESGPYYGAG